LVDEVIVLGEEIDLRCSRSGSADASRSTAEAATANAFQFILCQLAHDSFLHFRASRAAKRSRTFFSTAGARFVISRTGILRRGRNRSVPRTVPHCNHNTTAPLIPMVRRFQHLEIKFHDGGEP
jgi:hypothetical protein